MTDLIRLTDSTNRLSGAGRAGRMQLKNITSLALTLLSNNPV
jgi:hypothetical protein